MGKQVVIISTKEYERLIRADERLELLSEYIKKQKYIDKAICSIYLGVESGDENGAD